MKCTQCGNQAMYTVQGHSLCLNCYQKVHQIEQAKMAANVALLNFMGAQFEATVGMPGLCPRIQLPLPSVHQGNVMLNNIQLDRSIVGAINTGHIQTLDIAMSSIKNGEDPKLADLLQRLTEALLKSSDLSMAQKNQVIEHLSFLASQATMAKQDRSCSLGTTVLQAIDKTITVAGSLSSIWQVAQPALQSLFT